MTPTEAKPYNPTVDILRFISILAVILIHTSIRALEVTGFDLVHTSTTLFLNQASRFAVPLFFMISGFVLELNFPISFSYLEYLKKRLSRIAIPYLFWSTIYYFFVYTQHQKSFFQVLLSGDASFQLYFIPTLLIFYLVFPLIHKAYKFIANKWVLAFLGIVQLALLYFDYYKHPLPFFYPVSIALLNYFVFLLGIVASHHQDQVIKFVSKWKALILPLTLILGFWVYWEGKANYLSSHNYLSFYSQWRPSVLIYTLLLASFLYYLFNKSKIQITFIKTLSKLSFFVFFIHVIVLESLWYSLGIHLFSRQLWFDPAFFLATASLSFLVASLAHHIPYVSKLTG